MMYARFGFIATASNAYTIMFIFIMAIVLRATSKRCQLHDLKSSARLPNSESALANSRESIVVGYRSQKPMEQRSGGELRFIFDFPSKRLNIFGGSRKARFVNVCEFVWNVRENMSIKLFFSNIFCYGRVQKNVCVRAYI